MLDATTLARSALVTVEMVANRADVRFTILETKLAKAIEAIDLLRQLNEVQSARIAKLEEEISNITGHI